MQTAPAISRRRLAALGAVAGVSLAAGVAAGAGGGGTDAGPSAREPVDVLAGGAPLEDRLERAAERVDAVAARDPGELGVALAPVGEGQVRTGGELLEGQAWSAIKVPLVAAFLRFRAEEAGADAGAGALTARESELIEATLTRSDNEAASDLYAVMARAEGDNGARIRLQRALGHAGDSRTVVAKSVSERGRTEFGATTWRLEDALRYFRQLARGCLLTPPDTRLVLSYLGRLAPRQRWGMPHVVGPATPVAVKGGWGPGPDLRWLVEQVAIVGSGETAYVVAVMARSPVAASSRADPSSFDAGRRLVRRAAEEVQAVVGPPGSGPGAPPAGC